jgi:hypothetical protein
MVLGAGLGEDHPRPPEGRAGGDGRCRISVQGANVARFIDVHEGFVGVTQQQFEAAHELDLAIQAEEGVSFDQAWLDPVTGKAFCLATGPDKAAVIRIHERAGHPAVEVYELPITV